jgi:hypothetical protein
MKDLERAQRSQLHSQLHSRELFQYLSQEVLMDLWQDLRIPDLPVGLWQ